MFAKLLNYKRLKMKIEHGVMVMKGDKAWGSKHADGHSEECGWIEPADAPIHDPQFCKCPTDVTWKGSPDTDELMTGTLVSVIRRTEVIVVNEK